MNDSQVNLSTELLPTLKQGDTGNGVILLQSRLKALGFYDASVTGSFGSYTKNSVIRFQKEEQLTPNGIVDQTTWLRLYPTTSLDNPIPISEKPVLRLGSTGPYVTELQTILTRLLYYTETIDGNFGANTQNAVQRFQINNNLTPDGIVGRDTWSALEILYTPMAICEENGNGGETFTYTVVAGDTLWNLAQRFNTTVDAIKRLNNLTNDQIQIGQQLLIPGTNENEQPNYIMYTVVAGDTLWLLARRFNTTVNAIMQQNNLTSDRLSIGQILKIPTTNPPTLTYVVVAGDTLWLLARRFNTTVNAIMQQNNLTSDRLSIGQVLQIPQNT